ncbi:MAG TPA: aspartate/glutamate racemase family protein [Anaerolineales bacterium]|nr:aspartate/glutamate racemase family protein [Anaerolineales bacterium]
MTRRILVINPNTSFEMTADLKSSIEKNKLPDTDYVIVNPPEGPKVIETYLDEFISAIGLLKIIAAEKDNYDAFIIACGDDPGLFAAREITDKPVVAIGQAPMLLAPLLGRKFSIIGHWAGDKPRSEDKVAKYKLSEHLASVVPARNSALEIQANPETWKDFMTELGRKAIEEDGAEVLIFTGAAFVGMSQVLSERLHVPVLEGIACAVKLAEVLIDLGLRTTRVGQYLPLPKQKPLVGFPEFQQLYCFTKGE